MTAGEAQIPRPTPDAIELRCPTIQTAQAIREQWGAFCHVDAQDLRFRTVWLRSDTPEFWRERIERKIVLDREPEAEKYGQAPLADHERARLGGRDGWNYGRKGFHARSCKAIANKLDVDDWIAYYDHTVSVDTHKDIYHQAAGVAGDRQTMRRQHNPERERNR